MERDARRACSASAARARVTCRFTHVYPDGPAPYYTVLAPGAPRQRARAVGRDQGGRERGAARARRHDHAPPRRRPRPPARGTTASAPSCFARALARREARARSGRHPEPGRAPGDRRTEVARWTRRPRSRRSGRTATRSSRTRSNRMLVAALRDDLLRLERELGTLPASNDFEGRQTWRIYNLLVHGALYERIPVHANVLAGRRGRARRRLPDLVALLDRDRPRRDRAADPCGRPAHSARQAPPRDHLQHDVGAHRLHGRERRHAARARHAHGGRVAAATAACTRRSPPR